ncbi:MAG: adenylate/guanylate cyclase domain-containing protein [SAR324 cluster bacterium]|nr:adenylate/guanylate cyclase domain-containing protein [SAR324 cluster bacterium]
MIQQALAFTRRYHFGIHVRLVSGLMLFAFVSGHLINHSLGIFSVEAMEWGRAIFVAIVRSLPGTAILLAAVLLHIAFGLGKLLRMPSLRMPLWEIVQKVSGLLIPILLLPHIIVSRIGSEIVGYEVSYFFELLGLWGLWAIPMIGLVIIAWAHGCIGIHFWLRIRPGYPRLAPWLLGAAVALPLLALVGFFTGAQEVQVLATDPEWIMERAIAENWPGPDTVETLTTFAIWSMPSAIAFILLLIGLRELLHLRRRMKASVRIAFFDEQPVTVPRGTSVLEASRLAGIPHASVCGGRGRCSTCRVRVNAGLESLPPPNLDEQAVLGRMHAPPNVRLACQLRPEQPISVTPLLPPHAEPRDAYGDNPYRHGREMEVAVVFTDLRGFTAMTEKRLAYDVVFLLNRYFRSMGAAIEANGGHLVQVFGDGMMALFGIGRDARTGCLQALRVAKAMAENLDELNRNHPEDMAEPLRMGIGIHSGPVIVGEMGYHDAIILTAVGDAVNTASRLQEATKKFGCQLVLSSRVAEQSGVDLSAFPIHEMEVRGRTQTLAVHAVGSGHDLPPLPPEDAAPADLTPIRPANGVRPTPR